MPAAIVEIGLSYACITRAGGTDTADNQVPAARQLKHSIARCSRSACSSFSWMKGRNHFASHFRDETALWVHTCVSVAAGPTASLKGDQRPGSELW